MKNITRYGFLIFTILLTIIGFSKLTNSVNNGSKMASEYLRTMGGSMESNDFRVITEGYIWSNITLGGILFLVGLSFLCFSIYRLLKSLN
jgi:hypothetical protein